MSCDPMDPIVPNSGTLADTDVYVANALTATVVPGPLPPDPSTVTLNINCDNLHTAYDNSCMGAAMPFNDFVAAVQAQADTEASTVYNELAQFNDTQNALPAAIRVMYVRICIKIGWIKIYIYWHI